MLWRCRATARSCVAGSVNAGASSQFALMRLVANGSPDGGIRQRGPGDDGLRHAGAISGGQLAIQADGRIVVAGQSSSKSNPDFAVARFAANGALDAELRLRRQADDRLLRLLRWRRNVAVQPDGKIVVGGFARNGTRTGYGLVRIMP